MPLGNLLGLSEAVLDGLGPKKLYNKCKLFFKVFANAGFWVFEAFDGSLGPILAPFWADLVPKWTPKNSKVATTLGMGGGNSCQ